jgi:hypothetical protein
VSAITDWRYSLSEHAAVALFGGELRPDVVEVAWENQGQQHRARSRQVRTWIPISNLVGGYAAPLLKDFLQKDYFPAQGAAATAATAPITNKRKRDSSKGKNIKSKRAKPDDSQKNAPIVENDVPEQEAAAIAAPAVPVEEEATSITKQESTVAPEAVTPGIVRRCSSEATLIVNAASAREGIVFLLDRVLKLELTEHERSLFQSLQQTIADDDKAALQRSQSAVTEILQQE